MRLRTTTTNNNGQPSLTSAAGTARAEPQHVVYTRDASGVGRLYVNGALVVAGAVSGDLSNWNAGYPLALANELTGNRPWLGELDLVAVYDRALSADEVARNTAAGAE